MKREIFKYVIRLALLALCVVSFIYSKHSKELTAQLFTKIACLDQQSIPKDVRAIIKPGADNNLNLGGIKNVIGNYDTLKHTSTKTMEVPEDNRFVKRILTQGGFYEPTEMAILPNFDILVTQRRGELMKFDNGTKNLKQVGFLNVYYKTSNANVNSEEGLLGITADPNYNSNHYIYIYYSPAGHKSIDRLSRFVFANDSLDKKSEKVILEVETQREICCHTGGSLAFGKDNLLFVSAGDNSTPWDEMGEKYPTHDFGPMDDRPGHEQNDARRSAGNTNDLRGKILRLKINSDGSYDIPEGNLFPKGTPKTRPEIYVMGNRNPYRISVDKKTGYLYWGEVGPDALVDSIGTRGPQGYDEFNQARKAGNFGWPFFIGNNYGYNIHNYDTNENSAPQDPAKPLNNSRNNTGLVELPPAQPAYIWYPYARSVEFPSLGTGSRTALAGPVYHTADFAKGTRYPEYYNNKFFIYDFIRGWIKAVTQLPNGDLDKIEPFVPATRFNAMIDMEVGPDGRLYVLEYGKGWFSINPDAALSRIDYLPGNRPPALNALKVNPISGLLPLAITASIQATDPEKDALTYVWHIGAVRQVTKQPSLKYTITKSGEREVSVEVIDSKKASAKSNVVVVVTGNAQPQVNIHVKGNNSFFFAGKPVNYSVNVLDKGAATNPENLYVTAGLIKGSDMAGANLGHQTVSEMMQGKNLMLSLDCKACHKTDEKSLGPAFNAVAEKYKNNADANTHLPNKIIKGGSGVWGEVAMPAHPALKIAEARQIVKWILSLAGNTVKSLPSTGSIVPGVSDTTEQNTAFTINANYTDAGAAGIKPLSGFYSLALRNPTVNAAEFKNLSGFTVKDSPGTSYLVFPANKGSFKAGEFDITGITALELAGYGNGDAVGYTLEIHTGTANGPKIGSGNITFGIGNEKVITNILLQTNTSAKIRPANFHAIYIVVKQNTPGSHLPYLQSVRFILAAE